jgi:hypothetical protein
MLFCKTVFLQYPTFNRTKHMTKSFLSYALSDGYIHNWLALGPCDAAIAARPAPGETELAFRARLLAAADRSKPDFRAPMELNRFTCEGAEEARFWEATRCAADHQVEWSGFFPVYTARRAWAYVVLSSQAAQAVTLKLTTTCPATVWLNDQPVGFPDAAIAVVELSDQTPRSFIATAALRPRDNLLLVRLDQIAVGDAALAFALRVEGAPAKSVKVKVPTLALDAKERLALERAYDATYLDRAVLTPDDTPRLVSPEDLPGAFESVLRMQTPDGWIYGESFGSVRAGSEISGVTAVQLPAGPMQALVMPPHTQYYEAGLRAQRSHRFWVANRNFVQTPDPAYDQRMNELLREASRSGGVFGELAQMAADWWGTVDLKIIRAAIGRVVRQEAKCLPDLLGLASMRQRMAGHEKFPADLLEELDAALLGFDYSGATLLIAPRAEADQILLYTCQIIAGELFSRRHFTVSGATGRQECNRGESRASEWLQARAHTGFGAWNSQTDLVVAALAHLVDLAQSEELVDRAAVLLDKVLFGIAIHSFRGVFAGSRGCADPATLRSGRFAPEAAIGRLLWGMGGQQGGIIAGVSLMLAGQSYELPSIIHAIATDTETEVWARERQAGAGKLPEVNTAAYRTADFVLSSAQDYRPGEPGRRELVWQATLGPEALVYTTHPASFSESDSRDAGWWVGNGRLPRVAQWKDALIALYNLPEDDWLGFTHAYFPTYAFDEHALADGWAFARAGDAYLALYASAGLTLMRRGPDAQRELRSEGLRNVWLCQLGSRDSDTSFENFRQRVLAHPPVIAGLHVTWPTIRSERLEFDWTGPLRRNGAEEPITGFAHHESIFGAADFPAETMDMAYGQDVMRIHLA